ncbi:MAG: hypothetical protein IPF92_03590 [Myxococcales bacterium]|jgi:hypothetical protein|nr:hypothetical protein [Myxococcales bacterium]MBL0196654.1 hypothetical protein [Myxococcales bacterium]HQY62266.1 cytochrome c3 family protein [Polyangiaceae bacterium]
MGGLSGLLRATSLTAVLLAAGLFACGPRAPSPAPAVPTGRLASDARPPAAVGPAHPHAAVAGPSRAVGAMAPVRASRMGDRLAEVGLDIRHLPPLERLTPEQRRKVMGTFSDSLGIPCTGCHSEDNFRADTRRKRVAKRMYNEMARLLVLEDGEAVYCDGCHQGKEAVLDRRDKAKVSAFMDDSFVGKLRRIDGQEHDCSTCHGDPPEFAFVAQWKESPAPNLVLASEKQQALEKARAEAMALATPVAAPPAGQPVAVNAARTFPKPKRPPQPVRVCGEKDNLCPLQIWMRRNIAPAVTAGDTEALARAMDKLATFSPDSSWEWASMAKASAAAARRGDMDEARKACRGCHTTMKPLWRQKYRLRPVK